MQRKRQLLLYHVPVSYARDCPSYVDCIDRGRVLTKKLVDQGYTFVCVLHTPDLTSPDMTGYTLDYTTGPCCDGVTFIIGFVMFVD